MPAKIKNKQSTRSPIRIYFLIMTMVWVIGSLITIWILSHTTVQKLVISDKDYVIWERFYELDMCNQDVYKPTAINQNNYTKPTDAEKTKCKEEKMTQLIESRQASFKNDLLNSGIWAFLFIILLLTHYRKFLNKED